MKTKEQPLDVFDEGENIMCSGFAVKNKKGISKKTSVMIYKVVPPCDEVLEAVFSRPSGLWSEKTFKRIEKQVLKKIASRR